MTPSCQNIHNKPHLIIIDYDLKRCYNCGQTLPIFTILHNAKGFPDSYNEMKLKRKPLGDAQINSPENSICDHSPQNKEDKK
jgi:hypothetical protein